MRKYEKINDKGRQYRCYVCKESNIVAHEHYVKLCQSCGEYNEKKRLAKHHLESYIALITGGRTKIGYHTALRLLRDGSRVILTTRFPYDALQRYIQEPDFENWKDRIHIYELDFRQIERVEMFAHFIDKEFPYIDIIINNAAQTVRMSQEDYKELKLNEVELQKQIMDNQHLLANSTTISYFDKSANETKDIQNLQLFNQEMGVISPNHSLQNSWTAQSHQISMVEMLEVQLINVTAPFLLNTKLKDTMMRSPNQNRFIVNVSAAEGRFQMKRKGGYHVHTNMAKASLNMMTLTLSKEYKKHRIFVTSVDPGWVSNQFPEQVKASREINLPLDFNDAAARICDPIYEGKDAERPLTGVFLKDYKQVDW
ncbi:MULTISPECIES: SDR family NAD(P)-dependent oxidoreductase [Paenibacillus]|uniref:NAD(P)-dependent dehydrogenase (Short-subunit alcohol dehydrogenase family) n=1 Tax=Paenibacillus brasilensis TaxID=128574 RepID=A0ABU0L259_9BACL|nr:MULTISPECIES: SDR family oxidoreductase [Paenibacillus]MDQ0495778.1 NAD(P)-dependent dehydrogenase (short-subunit alcohol dehydrogenase family) [Paenibacillus brasilensis]URJ61189.3 SDR family oxidoreductase [Paenibacillus polymyxa]